MLAIVPKKLSNAERKALCAEIDKQLEQHVINMSLDLQAAVLWQLHEQLGFGKKRLLRFSKAYQEKLTELQKFYEIRAADDTSFIYRYKLKNEVGIDVEELEAMFCFNIKVK